MSVREASGRRTVADFDAARDDKPASHCSNCGEPFEPDDYGACCECCPACEGQGCIEQAGSCGGGCDYCPPYPRCYECMGTGKRS